MNFETSFGIIILPSLIIWCCGSANLLRLVRTSHSSNSTKLLQLPVAASDGSTQPSNRRISIRGQDIIGVIYEVDTIEQQNE